MADTLVYTGKIDDFYHQKLGRLQYRSLRFETETLDVANYQGVALMNYTDIETPYTRVIEHKH
ncbi:UDP-galactopyranose mutase, partial [Klebsiella pneumoniae]|uniref:UDP-galactopyranose mutase n=1 Tax=Klebsiella pneumoniae TaxID=573 RepID=UPI003A862F2F